MTANSQQRTRDVFTIFRNLRACNAGSGRLLFEDIEAQWLEMDLSRDDLILGLQEMADHGLLELQEIGRDSVFSITEAGVAKARELWDPIKSISGLAGFLIRRAQLRQNEDARKLASGF